MVTHRWIVSAWMALSLAACTSLEAPDPNPAATPPSDGVPAAAPVPEDPVELALRTAREHYDAGRFQGAIEGAEHALELDDQRAAAHFLLGQALSERIHQIPIFNQLPMARRLHQAFLRTVELDPESVEGHTALARFYSEAPPVAGGDPALAESHAERLVELDPVAGHTMRAALFTLWGRDDDAAAAHEQAEAARQGLEDSGGR